jgi:cobalt/nickel transport system ATP-binding protein
MTVTAPCLTNLETLTPAPLLAVSNLSFGYPGCEPVLRSITTQIYPGERVGLIGPNGAGKTTLFHSICGLLTPASGELWLGDRPILPREFRPELGLVFQNASDQLFSLTVRDDIAFGPINMDLDEATVAERVEMALELTGTLALADRAPHHLSGGERRMVAIASILAMQPQFVIYDEPSANLDLRARRRLINFLQEAEQTLMVASHDLEMLLEVCDRLLLLDEGYILANGDPRDILADAELMANHDLEVPSILRI